MEAEIPRAALGAQMMELVSGHKEPMWIVGSELAANQTVDAGMVKKAREQARSLTRSAMNRAHGWGPKEVAKFKQIEEFLGGLLRTYQYGELPPLADFRTHVAHAKDGSGRRLISSTKPILSFEIDEQTAKAAVPAVASAAAARAVAHKPGLDIDQVPLPNGGVRIDANDIASLYDFLQGLIDVGDPMALRLARIIMDDLGYNWSGSQPNPARSRSPKYVVDAHGKRLTARQLAAANPGIAAETMLAIKALGVGDYGVFSQDGWATFRVARVS